MDKLEAVVSWLELHKTGLGVLSTLIASIAAAISAWNAWSTKLSARKTALQSELNLVSIEAKSIQVEFEKIKRLGIDLRIAYQTLANFTGNQGSSRSEMIKNAAEEKVISANNISKKAIEKLNNFDSLRKEKIATLASLKVEFSLVLIELRNLSESMIADLGEIRGQVLLYQAKVANGT